MFDFARITVAVPDVKVGSVKSNKEDIISKIHRAAESGSDFVLFPELALTGYTCGDLFLRQDVLNDVSEALNEIATLSEKLKTVIIVGAPLEIGGMLFNCGVVISAGHICAVIPKTYVPGSGSVNEKRWFSPAEALRVNEIMSEDIGVFPSYKIGVGANIVLQGRENVKFGVVLGKDLDMPVPQSSVVALLGAEIIFNLSAEGETVGRREFRKTVIKAQSARCICAYAAAFAGCNESTTDMVYSGHGIVAEKGKILGENKAFIDNDYIMNCDIDLGKIRADRLSEKGFAENAKVLGEKCETVKVYNGTFDTKLNSDGSLYYIRKLPFVPENREELKSRCEEILEMQSSGLSKRLKATGGKVVVGVSGGLDSTLALLVCIRTMKKLRRPASDIIGITLPCFGTTSRTYNNATALMEALGVTTMNISIKDACLQHFKDIGHDENVKDVTYENVQARERTQVLMDVANKNGAIVCGTGDLSELALGWCTYNADHMSMYGVNSGVPKTLIRFMLEVLAETDEFSVCRDILLDVADTPISPELLPPDESGSIAQKTEDSVGPYALHDFFVYYTLRYGFKAEKIYELASRAFAGEYDGDTIKKWQNIFYRRLSTQQFKRSCLPDGVKVGRVGVSPRGDLILPSDPSLTLGECRANTSC